MAVIEGSLKRPLEEAMNVTWQVAVSQGYALAEGQGGPDVLVFKKGASMFSWGSQLTITFVETQEDRDWRDIRFDGLGPGEAGSSQTARGARSQSLAPCHDQSGSSRQGILFSTRSTQGSESRSQASGQERRRRATGQRAAGHLRQRNACVVSAAVLLSQTISPAH